MVPQETHLIQDLQHDLEVDLARSRPSSEVRVDYLDEISLHVQFPHVEQ